MTYSSVIKKTVAVDLTISATAYAALDQFGGLQELDVGGDYATLDSISVIDANDIGPELKIHLFTADPSQTSSDNDALAVPDAGLLEYAGSATVGTTAYGFDAGGGKATFEGGLGIGVKLESGKCYALAQSVGTPTMAATGGVRIKYGFVMDHEG